MTKGSGSLFSSQNPATGEIIWSGRGASPQEVDEAVQEAGKAFDFWANLKLEERSEILIRFSETLQGSKEKLAETISKETGKPLWDSLGEVESMINKTPISIEAYKCRCSEDIRNREGGLIITRHRPHGVVAVLGPYNFPGHIPNGHIIPALLAGNTVVFKPSELTPLVAEVTLSLWLKSGLPPGVIQLVQGGRETGEALIHHPGIAGIFFTGSYETGIHLSERFAREPSKILALEMGGNNPLVIGDISNLNAASSAIIQSAYLSSGQRCSCARRLILIRSSQSEKLLASLIHKVQTLSVGPYTQLPEPFMGPVISEKHALKLLESQEQLKSRGGKPLVEMVHLQPGTGFVSAGLMDATDIRERQDEEIFGPFLQLIRVDDLQEAIQEANRTKFGLSAGLLSDKEEEHRLFLRHVKAGIINWNVPTTGASSAAPFGGIKCSGNHRPSAYYAADYCSYPVASQESPTLNLT